MRGGREDKMQGGRGGGGRSVFLRGSGRAADFRVNLDVTVLNGLLVLRKNFVVRLNAELYSELNLQLVEAEWR